MSAIKLRQNDENTLKNVHIFYTFKLLISTKTVE